MNKRGAKLSADAANAAEMLDLGVESPEAEAFIGRCQAVMSEIAGGLHAGSEPGPEVEAESRSLLKEGRNRFGKEATGATMRRAMKREGWSMDQLVLTMRQGWFDPFS